MDRSSKLYEQVGYPFDLVDAIFNEETIWDNDNDRMDGLNHALETLSEREQKVIYLRFQEFKTLEDVAKEFNVTRERIRQIEAHAIRKLRHPSRSYYITYGYEGCLEFKKVRAKASELEKKEEELNEREEFLAERERKLDETLKKYKPKFDAMNISIDMPIEKIHEAVQLSVDIEEMDLSVRSYNCLRRSGIRTVGDLVKKCETDDNMDLLRVRNLGRKSLTEVLEKLYELTGRDFRKKYDIYIA